MSKSRPLLSVAVLAIALVITICHSASAAGPFGNSCESNLDSEPGTAFGLTDPTPVAGVITGWNMALKNNGAEATYVSTLRVGAPVGSDEVQVGAESQPVKMLNGINDWYVHATTRIPAPAGALLGVSTRLTYQGSTEVDGFYCEEQPEKEVVGFLPPSVSFLQTAPFASKMTGAEAPVTVTIEPDEDGDGYGDTTQDPTQVILSSTPPARRPPARPSHACPRRCGR